MEPLPVNPQGIKSGDMVLYYNTHSMFYPQMLIVGWVHNDTGMLTMTKPGGDGWSYDSIRETRLLKRNAKPEQRTSTGDPNAPVNPDSIRRGDLILGSWGKPAIVKRTCELLGILVTTTDMHYAFRECILVQRAGSPKLESANAILTAFWQESERRRKCL